VKEICCRIRAVENGRSFNGTFCLTPTLATYAYISYHPSATMHFTVMCSAHCFLNVLGRLFWVDLIKWVSLKCPFTREYVRSSTKSFFDFNEIWSVDRGRWVMHDGMHYDPIQGQGHEPFRVWYPAIFKSCLLCYLFRHLQWELATDHWFLPVDAGPSSGFSVIFCVCSWISMTKQ